MATDRPRSGAATFRPFCDLCEKLGETTRRKERTAAIAAYLGALTAADAEAAARLLVGRILPERHGRRLSIGWRTIGESVRRLADVAGPLDSTEDGQAIADFGAAATRHLPIDGRGAPLLLAEVVEALRRLASLSGRGSVEQRRAALADLLSRASRLEAKYIVKIAAEDLRHGAREGLVLEGIAAMSGLSVEEVRRAQQTLGDVGAVARTAKVDPEAVGGAGVELFRPIKPMLAQSAASAGDAFERLGGALALEWKLDGARVQIHARGTEVRVFTRRLNEVTASLPEIVALVRDQRTVESAIFEGEVLAVRDGRPLPFQELMRRFRRVHDVERMAEEVPVELQLFDLLHCEGQSLLDTAATERWRRLDGARGGLRRVEHIEPKSVVEAETFYRAAVAAGHEGVMAKALQAPYAPGARGKHWLKIKRTHTADLAVIAAEWGYGRRSGWLSNYHLAARGGDGNLVMVGKTFKGPTDAVFREMTERLLALETKRTRSTVHVRPQVVAEVKFEGVQPSDLYASGVALRFARIVRFRDDKPVDQVDDVETLRSS